MKTNTKVKVILGMYRGLTGKIVAKNRVKPAPAAGFLAVELTKGEETFVVSLRTVILETV